MDKGALLFRQQLEKLYADHHCWLCSLLRRKLGNAVDAADLAHDVYLKVMKRGHVPPEIESRRHLMQIARGMVIDLYRRRKLEAGHLGTLSQQPQTLMPCEESRAMAVQALSQIDSALKQHSCKAHRALIAFRLDGMGHREIAAELQVSVSSVEKYIAVGLKTCRRIVPHHRR